MPDERVNAAGSAGRADLVADAVAFAEKAHRGQVRKGTSTPYIVHPMEAAAIVATMTSDPAVIAAAVLHDVIEDTDYTADDVRRLFGPDVLALIEGDSEDKRQDRPAAETWEVRKQETINYVKNRADVREKMIVLADKLSNLRAICRDLAAAGPRLWDRFNQKDPTKHKWYYAAVIAACAELSGTEAFREAVDLIENRIRWGT